MSSLLWQVRSRTEIAMAKPWAWSAVASLVLLAAALLAATQGVAGLSLPGLFAVLANADEPMHRVLWDVRLPRLICSAGVGASLAIAGLLLQTTVRNPLADPGILGVTTGAGVGGLVLLIFFPDLAAALPFAAFVGGVAAVATVLALAWTNNNNVGPLRMVLSGVALQAMLFAVIALLTFAYADRAPAFAGFTVGSLNGTGWSDARILAVPTLAGFGLACLMIRSLDVLLLDDASAGGLGLAVRHTRMIAACVAALLAAGAVSVAGLVSFVGLVVPNGMRLLVGPTHGALLPACAIAGAALMVLADTVARTVLSPLELPVGAFMALIGGPYFLYLLWKKLS